MGLTRTCVRWRRPMHKTPSAAALPFRSTSHCLSQRTWLIPSRLKSVSLHDKSHASHMQVTWLIHYTIWTVILFFTPLPPSTAVTYSWQLRFEFVTGQDRVSLGQMVASPSGSHQEWRGGKVVPYKTSLTLPVTILSTNPAHVESRFITKQVIEI